MDLVGFTLLSALLGLIPTWLAIKRFSADGLSFSLKTPMFMLGAFCKYQPISLIEFHKNIDLDIAGKPISLSGEYLPPLVYFILVARPNFIVW